MKTKVALISVYLGQIPEDFFKFTKKTIHFNEDFDWFIFSDNFKELTKEKNIYFVPTNIDTINSLLTEKINKTIKLPNVNKLVDTKPAWADIFYEYIKNYDWWGWTDLDIIYGNLNKFITDEVLNEFDCVSVLNSTIHSKPALCGPFTLFSMKHKELYKEIENIDHLINELDVCNRGYANFVDELYMYDEIIKNNLKIYKSYKLNNHDIGLIRYGKRKTPARWINGTIELDTYKEDYWKTYSSTYGCDTMLFHLRPYHVLSENNGQILINGDFYI
jgi:hypothetical protein